LSFFFFCYGFLHGDLRSDQGFLLLHQAPSPSLRCRIRSVDQIIGPEVLLLFVFGWGGVRPGTVAR
jgi:hypothetical protein